MRYRVLLLAAIAPALPDDPQNPITPVKVELERQLFEDARLSGDESFSCASCHPKEMGYADAVPLSERTGGQRMPRHTPTVLNAAYHRYINWDGKFAKTSELVLAVLANPKNMNMQDERVLVSRLEAVPEYREQFRDVVDGPPTKERVVLAIDAYVRGLTTPTRRSIVMRRAMRARSRKHRSAGSCCSSARPIARCVIADRISRTTSFTRSASAARTRVVSK